MKRWVEVEGGWVGSCGGLTAAVSPNVHLPTEHVLHLLEVHVGYGDGRRASLFEAGLEVEGHQEVLADEQGTAEAWHALQVLQVTPQQNGAFALLAAVAVHRQHMDVHGRGVWDVMGHGLLGSQDGIGDIKYGLERIDFDEFPTCESLSLSQPEPMMKATNWPPSNQPRDSSGHMSRNLSTSSRVSGQSPDTDTNAGGGGTFKVRKVITLSQGERKPFHQSTSHTLTHTHSLSTEILLIFVFFGSVTQ